VKGNPIPTTVRKVVRERDNQQCVRCGARVAPGELHHRRRRGVGLDPHVASNLLMLCGGPAHDGCHQWVHAHPEAAMLGGFIISVHDEREPGDVPVASFMGPIRLRADGGLDAT
jgi:hypothetical protein